MNTRAALLCYVVALLWGCAGGNGESGVDAQSTPDDGATDVHSDTSDTTEPTDTHPPADTNPTADTNPSADTNITPDVLPTTCETYCGLIAENCTDNNVIDFGDSDCVTTCAGWAAGADGDTSGDSVACRIDHAGDPAAGDPATHCPHASPEGGGVCVDVPPPTWCEISCSASAAACEPVPDGIPECLIDCKEATESGPCGSELKAFTDCQPADAWTCNDGGEPELVVAEACKALQEEFVACETSKTCDPNPCKNGGQCEEYNEGTLGCSCADGYYGTYCQEVVTPCEPVNPCANQASCTVNEADASFTCDCPEGFIGDTCAIEAGGPCDPDPCSDGTCKQITALCQGATCDDATCQEAVGALDDYCLNNWDVVCASCANGEKTPFVDCTGIEGCSLEKPIAMCLCDAGWEGDFCDVDIDECASAFPPCLNGGVCTNSEGDFTCKCAAGWEGKSCEINPDDCPNENPCQNGGACVDGLSSYTCECSPGWDGPSCEVGIDLCSPNPCQNEATCGVVTLPGPPVCQDPFGSCQHDSCIKAVTAFDPLCENFWDEFCAACAAGGKGWDDVDCSSIDPAACTLDDYLAPECTCVNDYVGETCDSCGQCGDVNGDGSIDEADSQALIDLIPNIEDASDCLSWRSDANGDGEVNVIDVTAIGAGNLSCGEMP